MKKIIYTDGMASIGIAAGAIRMDLCHRFDETGDRLEKEDVFAQLIMGPQGFVDSFVAMYKLVYQLNRHGMIKLPSLPPLAGSAINQQPIPASAKQEAAQPERSASTETPEDDDVDSPNF